MTEYLGRTGSCTAGSKYPDHNLTAYAAEHGFETALLGVVFCGEGRPSKIYSYWGHTGIRRGHYIKVMVPSQRGRGQEEKFVKVMSVLPANGLKADNDRTAKHMLEHIGTRASYTGAGRIPIINSAEPALIERWRVTTCNELLPLAKTEHARSAIGTIDGLLGVDPINGDHQAVDYKCKEDRIDALAFGHSVHRAMEKQARLGAMYGTGIKGVHDLSELEMRIAADYTMSSDEYKQFERDTREQWEKLRNKTLSRLAQRMPSAPPYWSLKDLPQLGRCGGTDTGRLTGIKPNLVIIDELFSDNPKESPMSTKVETVTYVTLAGVRYEVSQVTAEQFFNGIAALEKEVAKLEGINNKPRALQEKIDDLNQQIQTLSRLCDEQHAAKSTGPVAEPLTRADLVTYDNPTGKTPRELDAQQGVGGQTYGQTEGTQS